MPEYEADTLDLSLLPFWEWGPMSPPQSAVASGTIGVTLDSFLPLREVEQPMQRPSMFRRHSLQVEHQSAAVRNTSAEPAWVFIALVVISGLLCLYYKMRHLKPWALTKAAVDGRALERLVRDCNLNRGVVMVSMGLLLMASATLPVVRLVAPQASWWVYLGAAAAMGLLYVLRNGVMRWLGNVFERRQEVVQYITSNYVYHLLEASVLTVGLYFHFYLPSGGMAVLVGAGALLAVGFVARLARGGKIILTHASGSDFYLFYYLCIVELIPAVVALRLFIVQ